MMKLITALKKLPYAIPFHDNLERFSTLAALTTGLRISGVMISLTSEVIIALKAAAGEYENFSQKGLTFYQIGRAHV